jgi:Tetratricopeptide repeat
VLFHLVVIVYPKSANAYDSYGDGLSAAGRPADACAAFARALALAPSDSTLGASERATIVHDDTQRLKSCPSTP